MVRAKEFTGWAPDFIEYDSEKVVENNEGPYYNLVNLEEGEIEDLGVDQTQKEDVDSQGVADTFQQGDHDMEINQEERDSEDPFGIHDLLAKENRFQSSDAKMTHPPGFTPLGGYHQERSIDSQQEINKKDVDEVYPIPTVTSQTT